MFKPSALALFHLFNRYAAKRPVLVGDVAIAVLGLAQLSVGPAAFGILARGDQSAPLQAHVFAGGDVRSGRKNFTDLAIKNPIDVHHALGATVRVMEKGRRFMSVIALADGMERAA